jgi:large subunit ribosomal protein L3
MTQVFDEQGNQVPVTVLQAGPCVVVGVRSQDRDGYRAAQVGLVEHIPAKRLSKPRRGQFEKHDLPPMRHVREFRIDGEDTPALGDKLNASLFQPADRVDVVGVSKGKGFQGVIKRHGFSGGRASHGSMFHRAPGSIGASAYPSRVYPGMRGPGHMGHRRVTVKNLEVVRVDEENNMLVVKGSVPGARGSYLVIRRSQKARRNGS